MVNGLTAKLMNRLTARLLDLLTTKLVVVNLVKLHLTKFTQQKIARLAAAPGNEVKDGIS